VSEDIGIPSCVLMRLVGAGYSLMGAITATVEHGEPMPLPDEDVRQLIAAIMLAERALEAVEAAPVVSAQGGRA
jgi:hypothetical protein